MAYEMLAPFYDAIHAELVDDAALMLALATQAGGAILELGCGTGRLLEPLARGGFSVYGVDNSAAMLLFAEKRLAPYAERVTLVKADIATFAIPASDIALAIIGYNTFMHVRPPAATAALRRIVRHLRTGGKIVLDLLNPFAVAALPDDRAITYERTFTRPDSGERVVQSSCATVDAADQTYQVIWFFDTISHKGDDARRTVAAFDFHYYYPHQIELYLDRAGFRLERLWGNYDQSPFSEESERLIVVAERR